MKMYVRDGKRFRPIPNVIGMYWDGENWTKERTNKSIARCYNQEGIVLDMFFLEKLSCVNWYDATNEAKLRNGYLPSHAQAALAIERCEELRKDNDWYWTRDESSFNFAWRWSWLSSLSFAYFYDGDKSIDYQGYCARIFFELNL